MPFENLHACRIRDPEDFDKDSFRASTQDADGKPIQLIVGRLIGESGTTLQSFRYPKDSWSVAQARKH